MKSTIRTILSCLMLTFSLIGMTTPCSGQVRKHHFTVGGGYADYHTLYHKLGGWCFNEGINFFGRYDYTIARYFCVGAIGEYSCGPSFFRGSIKHVAEFVVLPAWKVNPYIGFVAGPACGGHRDWLGGNPKSWKTTWMFMAGPRAGFRLFKYIDVGVEIDYSIPSIHEVYNSINLNLGIRF